MMIQLDQRQLGATGITVPPLGVGIWSWGEKTFWGYGKTHTFNDVWQAYETCLDAGLNFFDTAEIYGRGESERILGECGRKDGRPVIIASKFAPLPWRLSTKTLSQALDATLERLGRTSIDLYQVHWPYSLLGVNALMDALAQVVRSGKIRAVGVSNYSADLMRQAHARLARYDIPLASNQVHYSLLHRRPEANGVLDACRALGVTLIAYSPLEQGLLTGKYRLTEAQPLAIPGPRRLTPAFSKAQRRRMEPLLQALKDSADAHGKTMGQVALNWLLTTDTLVIPIPGAKNARQAGENAGALGWHLTQEEYARVDLASRPWLR